MDYNQTVNVQILADANDKGETGISMKKKTAEEWRRLAEERIGDDGMLYSLHRSRGSQVWDDTEELYPQLTALTRQDGWLPPKRKPPPLGRNLWSGSLSHGNRHLPPAVMPAVTWN